MSVLTSSGYGAVLVNHTRRRITSIIDVEAMVTINEVNDVIPVWVDMLQATGTYFSHNQHLMPFTLFLTHSPFPNQGHL